MRTIKKVGAAVATILLGEEVENWEELKLVTGLAGGLAVALVITDIMEWFGLIAM